MRKAEDDLKKTEVNTKLLIQVTLSVLEWLYQHFLLIFSENSNFSAVIPVLDYQQLKLALKKKNQENFSSWSKITTTIKKVVPFE